MSTVQVRVTGGYVVGASAGVTVLAVEVDHQQRTVFMHQDSATEWSIIKVE
jgi:hypothetical protein